jgi:hypothetical protein
MRVGNDKRTANGRSVTGAINPLSQGRKSRKTKVNANGGQVPDRPGKCNQGWPPIKVWPTILDWPVVDWEPADGGGKDTPTSTRKQR